MADPASFIAAGMAQLPTYPPPRMVTGGDPELSGPPLRRLPSDTSDGAQACGHAEENARETSGRRAYNREYMRLWRQRNRQRYLEYNRAYQRKTAHRRKMREVARDAALGPKCAYGCGRRATQTIERIDPRTWQPVSLPYCGSC